MGKCHFKEAWMQQLDCNGVKICTWAKKIDDSNILCCCCDKKILIIRGIQAIEQHSRGSKHKIEYKQKFGENQLKLGLIKTPSTRTVECGNHTNSTVISENTPAPSISLITLCDEKKLALRAELIWTMRSVCRNQSFLATDGIKETLEAMFPGKIPEGFNISEKKVRYLVTDALAPYFKDCLREDMSDACYTLLYDETTNVANHKELQLRVRYWSESDGLIVTRHLNTSFLGHATANDLKSHIEAALEGFGLSKNKMLMLGSDGPNVNKKVFKEMNDDLLSLRKSGLINIGTCNIHTAHNAFLKGLNEFGIDVSELAVMVKYFFKGRPSRWEDFQLIQHKLKLPAHAFIKHVSSRWLTLSDAANRLIEQWSALAEYFLRYIPKKCLQVETTATYKVIKNYLKKPLMKCELLFVISCANIFTKFTKFFQAEEPLIHVLYSELQSLISTILLRFIKGNTILNFSSIDIKKLFQSEQNLLNIKDVAVGEEVENQFIKDSISEKDVLMFKNSARKHYMAVCTHLLAKTTICSTPLVKYLQCLHPNSIRKPKSVKYISKIAAALPGECNLDMVCDEWKLLQIDTSLNTSKLAEMFTRIDLFWHEIFLQKKDDNTSKYPYLAKVIKQALTLSHGNADVERGFSISGKIFTEDRNRLSERTLNAILIIKSALLKYNNKVELISIDNKLLRLANTAHHSYKSYNDNLKKQKEDEEQRAKELREAEHIEKERIEVLQNEKVSIAQIETSFNEKEKELGLKIESCNKLLTEANSKLKSAVKKKDMVTVNMSQMLLETVNTRIAENEEERQNLLTEKKKLEKRKLSMLDKLVNNKPKQN